MGGVVKSAGGFLGLGGGPGVDTQGGNAALSQLNAQNSLYAGGGGGGKLANQSIQDYAFGNKDLQSALTENAPWLSPEQQTELQSALATNPLTGSKYATEQVQSNPILSQLFGQNGALSGAIGKEQSLQNQGFQLTPEDHEAYGQASGNIARMFGQQESSLAQALADRGLSSAPNGAASVGFTGLQGNKNEQLAQAQMQIANQRMQNTQQRIAQQQSFINSLGGQANTAINDQYSRQLAGAQNQKSGLQTAAGLQNSSNTGANQANLANADFAQKNKPQNFFDMAQTGAASATGAAGKTGGQAAGAAMFG